MKAYRIIHLAANIIAFGLLGAFLIYFLFSFGSLPDTVGVHFDPQGEPDVFASKLFGFYPFAAGFGLLGIFSLLTFAVNKIKNPGFSLSDKGNRILRCVITLLLDLLKLIWAGFFSVWTYCVVHEIGMSAFFTLTDLRNLLFLLLIPLIAVAAGINDASKWEKAYLADAEGFRKKKRTVHIAINAAAFGALAVMLVYMLIMYGGLPERIGVHFGGDGSFDVIDSKLLGFYPFAAGFGLLGALSLCSLAVNKLKKLGMKVTADGEFLIRLHITRLTDMMKFIVSVFFTVWAYCVINQVGMETLIPFVLAVLFILMLPAEIAAVIFTSVKYKPKNEISGNV